MNNLFEKIDSNLVSNELFSYLYYEDIIQLGKTNKQNHHLIKNAIKLNHIKKIKIGDIYQPKIWNEFRKVLESLNPPEYLSVPPDFIQILDYSNSKNTIKFKYIPIGIYKNIFYPVLNNNIKILSYRVQYPNRITHIVENMDQFFNVWEKVEDNSNIVYSIQYIHPLLKYTIYRYLNIILFTSLFFLAYFIFVFFFILIKNNFLQSNNDDSIHFYQNYHDIEKLESFNNYIDKFEYNDASTLPIFYLKKNIIFLVNQSFVNNLNGSNGMCLI